MPNWLPLHRCRRTDCSFSTEPSRGHSAHVGQEVVVHYRWHPLYGRHVRRHYSEQRANGEVVHVEGAPGVVTIVAAWMLDPVACVGMEIGAPRIAPSALLDLQRLLIALGFRRDSSDDWNVAQEDHDEVSETGATLGRTPTGQGSRFSEASRDEPRRAQRGNLPACQIADGGCRSPAKGERR